VANSILFFRPNIVVHKTYREKVEEKADWVAGKWKRSLTTWFCSIAEPTGSRMATLLAIFDRLCMYVRHDTHTLKIYSENAGVKYAVITMMEHLSAA